MENKNKQKDAAFLEFRLGCYKLGKRLARLVPAETFEKMQSPEWEQIFKK